MIRIFKYPLAIVPEQSIEATVHRWLGVGWQGDQLVAWAEVEAGVVGHARLGLRVTGEAPPDLGEGESGVGCRYIGSAQRDLGEGLAYVVHVYQLGVPG